MVKNTASQKIGCQMVSATDGSAFTGAVTVSVTGDAGTQATGSVGAGACTHEGNGYHTYAPAQAETNYDLVAFTFTGSGAVPTTVQVFTNAGDAFTRLGAPAGASVSADVAAVKVDTAAILVDTGTTLDGRIPAALVSGRMDVSVGAMAANVLTATAINADAITAAKVAADVSAEIADAVWDEAVAGHVSAGTFGATDAAILVDTGTTLDAAIAAVKVDTAAILVDTGTTLDARIPATLVSGRMDVSVGAMAANTLTAAATAADFGAEMATAVWTDTTAGDFTAALSVGKSVMNGVSLGTGLTVAAVSGAVGSVTGAVGSVTGAVGSVTAGVSVASGGIISGAHAAAELNAIADALLDRNMATGTDNGTDTTAVRTVRQALRRLRNKESIAAGTLTITKENDTTASWTAAVTTTAGDPLSAVDPT